MAAHHSSLPGVHLWMLMAHRIVFGILANGSPHFPHPQVSNVKEKSVQEDKHLLSVLTYRTVHYLYGYYYYFYFSPYTVFNKYASQRAFFASPAKLFNRTLETRLRPPLHSYWSLRGSLQPPGGKLFLSSAPCGRHRRRRPRRRPRWSPRRCWRCPSRAS